MPFDPIKLRDPRVTVLPPTPPERGGPRRVHIQIEIAGLRPEQSPRRGYGSFTLAVFVLLLLAGLAHGQPRDGGIHYEHWQDNNGRHGEVRTQGTTTDTTSYGPNGEQHGCHRYYVLDQAYTSCR